MNAPTTAKAQAQEKTAPAKLDIEAVRQDFPILASHAYGKPLVYLDNAASAQKPMQVTQKMTDCINQHYANVHRGLHYLSNQATEAFENVREVVQHFLNARDKREIIFTSGATDAINLVAQSFAAPRLVAGDEIILSVMEHHSNIVPWHFLRERQGVVLKWVPMGADGAFDFAAYERLITPKTKLIAMTQMSNALGTIPPMQKIIRLAHDKNIPVLVDGCQGAVHMPTNVQELDCDFYVFAGHKLYGPTGIGILYGKLEHLEDMRPYRGGGEMISEVTQDKITYADLPHRFEAGTPPIVEVVGLGAALEYVTDLGQDAIATHEADIFAYAMELLKEIKPLKLFGTAQPKGSIISFGAENIHPHDLATIIDREGVAVRAGHHCAQPLMTHLGVSATARASFALYNTRQEAESLAAAIDKALAFFK
ncbi:MAG: cysteine desulfurase [Alphaproteobacteria bacterium]|nr:cysteine desulfurase [Alphaproteobacteria bacterium]